MSGTGNLSAVVFKKGDMRLVDRPIPEPGPGEVQLKMGRIGICGSDVKFWYEGAIGPFIVKEPMLLGHECSGIVNKLGPGVTNLKVGDRVAIEPGIPCRRCDICKLGRYNLCKDVFFLATPPDSGALARYHVHAADFCYKLPDHLSLEEGALVEPLSVGLHACRRAGVTLGKKLLITGSGPIGLSTILCGKAMGAAEIIVTDIDSKRLEFAKKMGATRTVKVVSKDPVEVARQVQETLGSEPDCAVEASGAQFSAQVAIHALKPGSTFAVVGHGPSDIQIPIVQTITREITILGSWRYANTWPTAIDMLASGIVDVKPMVTHTFTLEQTIEAFQLAKSGAGVKIIIDCEKKA